MEGIVVGFVESYWMFGSLKSVVVSVCGHSECQVESNKFWLWIEEFCWVCWF